MRRNRNGVVRFGVLGLSACGLVLVVGLGACAVDEPGSEPAPDGLSGLQGAPLSPALQATIEANDGFQVARRQLEGHGDLIALERSTVYRHDGALGVVCPIEHAGSGAGEYKDLVYQEAMDAAPAISLELSNQSVDEAESGPEPQAYTCGGWSSWYTISTYCTWHIMCLGDATMLVRERTRTCCATTCWTETEHTTVRNRCGC